MTTDTHTNTHKHTHSQAHAHTHTHTHTQTHTLSHTHTFIAGAEACTAVLGRLGPLPSPLVWRGGVHHPPYGRPTTP